MEHMFEFMKRNVLQFTSYVPDHMTCTICKNVLIDSRFSQCGCKFCLNCITKYLLDGCKGCPSGKKECGDVVLNLKMDITKDPLSDTQISNFTVRCPHESCDHECRLRMMPDHVLICNNRPVECEFSVVGCEQRVTAGNCMSNHMEMENIGHVRLLLGFLRKMENEMRHKIGTLELRLEETGELNERRKQEWQTEKNELLTSICEMKEKMDEMKAVEEHTANEMQRTIRTNEELEKKIQCQNETIEEMTMKLREIENQVKENERNVEKKLEDMEENMKKICDDVENSSMEVALHTLRSIQDDQTNIIQQAQVQDRQEAETMKQTLLKEIKRVEETMRCGEFIWRVEGIKNKRREAADGRNERICSEYFYSQQNGYRMRLVLFPNGYDDGIETHLSLYFFICKGSFDDILQWPMKMKIRLSIVKHGTGQEYIGYDYSYELYKDTDADIFQKPVDKNLDFGHSKFITWDEMQKSDDILKNDVIFIRCSFPFDNLNFLRETTRCGEFIWKVEEMTDKRQDAAGGGNERIFSEYFYSHQNGYRMRLTLFPNGYDDGKETHLSLYFFICKGSFDDVLQWPMNKKIRLAIVKQGTGQEHVGYEYSYMKHKITDGDIYQKPVNENMEFGHSRFIKWDEFQKSGDILKNDVIFIRCSFPCDNMNFVQETTRGGEFIWKVEDMKDKRQVAIDGRNERIFSEYFYSHKNGYRMRLSMYPNGYGDKKGTHLSLYFIICKGSFDDVLQWPMNKKIRLAIVKQGTGQDHIGYEYSYMKNKLNDAVIYQKPVDENIEFGHSQFIKWDELQQNKNILNNDVLFIKCSFAD